MEDETEFEYEFELVDTDDPLTMVLVCVSSEAMTPSEYGHALINYAQLLINKNNMSDVDQTKVH